MANPNAPFGFKPYRHLSGGIIRHSAYKIADALAANIFFGDAVKSTGANRITPAAAGNTILGIFAGVNYVDASGNVVWKPNWVTGTDLPGSSVVTAEALIYDDPNITFMVQSNVTIADTDIGDCADLVATAGDSTTGISKFSLDTPAGGRRRSRCCAGWKFQCVTRTVTQPCQRLVRTRSWKSRSWSTRTLVRLLVCRSNG
jgi:hypothetical protein